MSEQQPLILLLETPLAAQYAATNDELTLTEQPTPMPPIVNTLSPQGSVATPPEPLVVSSSSNINSLFGNRPRHTSYATLGSTYTESSYSSYSRMTDNEDGQSVLQKAAKFTKRRFWWFAIVGIIFMIIWQLSFLPRTSLSRDFRRWYGLRLTEADIIRDYLVLTGINRKSPEFEALGKNLNPDFELTPEELLHYMLLNLTHQNSSPVNIVSGSNSGMVNYVTSKFRERGLRPKLFTYDSYPIQLPESSSLKILDNSKVVYEANLLELKMTTPAFNLGGFHGDVEAPYINVNFGLKEDYEFIINNGIDVNGTIVIVREMSQPIDSNIRIPVISTQEKIRLAQSYGAVGFIIYNDLASTESLRFLNYMNAFKNTFDKSIIQRCTLMDGISENNASSSYVTIPSIPISYKDALPLLNSFAMAEGSFQGWDYHPSPVSKTLTVHLSTNFKEKTHGELVNIIGEIRGLLQDSEVIFGASRDTLTLGNPLSSHAILLEIARGYQNLLRIGWRPLRTIKFISWDGTHSGKAGSKAFLSDEKAFDRKKPISAYINLDCDTIRGSKLSVDGHPELDHLVKNAAAYVPFPRVKVSDSIDNNEEMTAQGRSPTKSLLHYWRNQNNATINGILSESIIELDSFNFEQHECVPVINLKFDVDSSDKPSIYPKNSNFFLNEWVTEIDNDYLLHGLMVRFAGLLGITLCDHEVVDYQVKPYAEKLKEHFEILKTNHNNVLEEWKYNEVSQNLINKEDIYTDLKTGPFDSPKIKFNNLTNSIENLLDKILEQTVTYDKYNHKIQENLFVDYAWYHLFMKIKHYTQFKLANYKLLRLENELKMNENDFKYAGSNNQTHSNWLQHSVFGRVEFNVGFNTSFLENRDSYSAYGNIQEALLSKDFESSVKWLAVTYRKLKGYYKKIS